MIAADQMARIARDFPDGFRAIADVTREGVVVANDERIYVEANSAACALLERDRDAVVGHRIDDLAHPPFRPEVDHLWKHFVERGKLRGRCSLGLPDGSPFEVAFDSVANFVPGRHIAVVRPFSHVLILEDDPDLAQALVLLLEGEKIACEAPGDMGLEPHRLPALALVDLSIPDVARIVTTLRRAAVPIVVVSGSREADQTSRAWGALRCVRKPFDPAEILETVGAFAPQLVRAGRASSVLQPQPPSPLVRFTFVEENGCETVERVRPVAVRSGLVRQRSAWILTAFDPAKGAERTFELDRVRGWQPDSPSAP